MNKEEQLMEQIGQPTIEHHELIKKEPVIGTPFELVTTDEGTFVALGHYRLSESMTEDEACRLIVEKDWNFLLSVINVFVNQLKLKENEQ